jgi:8-oxo-dGTP pyrophosphatase MutT (NUDIX family)
VTETERPTAAPGPTPAATIVLVRDGAKGAEALLLRRHESLGFLGGLWVFPGGKIEAADEALAGSEHPVAAAAVGGIRELFEETGLLLASPRHTTFNERLARHGHDWRTAVHREGSAFATLLRTEGLNADVEALVPWAHWIPPSDVPRRFDTWFFVAHAPTGQTALVDATESTELRWVTLDGHVPDDLPSAPPTHYVLLELAAAIRRMGSLDAMLADARLRLVPPLVTRRVETDGVQYAVFPWDPDYASLPGEGAPWPADHPDLEAGLPTRLPIPVAMQTPMP